jgi:hypothetical protein
MIYLILQESAINEKMVILNTGKKNVKGAETRWTLREGKETRRRVGFMPPCLRCHGEEGKRGGVWAPRRLVLDAAVKKGNEAACGIHVASSSMTQRRGETRRRVGSTPPRLRCPRKEGKRGGVWAPHRLVFDAPEKRGNEAACGLHTASSSMAPEKRGNKAACGLHTTSSSTPQEGVKTRRRVDSTPPRLRCHGKDKRGGMWFPCRLVVDAAGRRGNNEAACGFHATSLGSGLLPSPGCSPRPDPPLFPSLFAFSNYWLLSGSVSWQPSDWSMSWARAMVGGDDVAPTSLNKGRGNRWLNGSRRGGVTWWDLKKIQHLVHHQTHMFGHMTNMVGYRLNRTLIAPL